ncbi:MAG: ATP-binding cassette domain-containing protein [Lachnospiraceae bacterium]|nr:ATP-binding cassette domain-containing protein [Lachnospiraceae bacterium]
MTKIEIKNVTKKFRNHTVIDNVSLEMRSGTVTGLRGINGSGKTMLMRLICGLILPTEGEILINGKVLGKDMDFPESLGFLIENPAFLESYSGFDNLKMLANVKRCISDQEIMDVISRVGLDPTDKKKYKKYSLGMKQRLGIAGAIMEKPDIVLLDEPTNALDTKGIDMLKKIVSSEKERGALVVLTCHDTAILEEMADEIHFMEDGRIVNV